MIIADKGDILTISNTAGNYKAVFTGRWTIRHDTIFYSVIKFVKPGRHWPGVREVGEDLILNVSSDYPEFKIGESVRLADRRGTLISIEDDHFKVRPKNRTTTKGRKSTPGICSVPKHQFLVMNPKELAS